MDTPSQILPQLQIVLRALEDNNYGVALPLIENLLSQFNSPHLLLSRAIALQGLGMVSEAEECLRSMRKLFPEFEAAQSLLEKISSQPLNNEAVPSTDSAHQFQFISAAEYLESNPTRGNAIAFNGYATESYPEPVLYILKDIPLVGEWSAPVLDHFILKDAILHEAWADEQYHVRRGLSQNSGEKLCGPWLSLCNMWDEGFWHWMMEALPMVLLAEVAGFNGSYLIPPGAAFIKESLNLLGIESDRLRVHTGGSVLVEELFHLKRIRGGSMGVYPKLLTSLREKLITASRLAPSIGADKRIYVSRNKFAKRRRVVNENDVYALLKKHGFVSICMEELSLAEQIAKLSHANALVTPHGAGMVHTLFMSPASTVVELFPPTYINPCCFPAIQLMQHRYHMSVALVSDGKYPYGEDIKPCLAHLGLILQQELLR